MASSNASAGSGWVSSGVMGLLGVVKVIIIATRYPKTPFLL